MKPVSRSTDQRLLITLGTFLVFAFISSALLAMPMPVVVGLVAGGVAWLLTRPREIPPPPPK